MPDVRYCLITGASRGLGRALAHKFWRQGWNLVLLARDEEALGEVVSAVGAQAGQSLQVLAADLGRPGEVERVVDVTRSLVPRLDALINNAGIQGPIGPVWANGWDEWLDALQVDLLAPVGLCRLVAPWMVENGRGSIINLSGGGASGPRPNFSAYATAKAGLVRFSETLADELRASSVRVNCVAPGAMSTGMLEGVLSAGASAAGETECENAARALRGGTASLDAAVDLCLFLASDAAAGITGKLISAIWDDWERWPEYADALRTSDVYTLRRITGRDRGSSWGDR